MLTDVERFKLLNIPIDREDEEKEKREREKMEKMEKMKMTTDILSPEPEILTPEEESEDSTKKDGSISMSDEQAKDLLKNSGIDLEAMKKGGNPLSYLLSNQGAGSPRSKRDKAKRQNMLGVLSDFGNLLVSMRDLDWAKKGAIIPDRTTTKNTANEQYEKLMDVYDKENAYFKNLEYRNQANKLRNDTELEKQRLIGERQEKKRLSDIEQKELDRQTREDIARMRNSRSSNKVTRNDKEEKAPYYIPYNGEEIPITNEQYIDIYGSLKNNPPQNLIDEITGEFIQPKGKDEYASVRNHWQDYYDVNYDQDGKPYIVPKQPEPSPTLEGNDVHTKDFDDFRGSVSDLGLPNKQGLGNSNNESQQQYTLPDQAVEDLGIIMKNAPSEKRLIAIKKLLIKYKYPGDVDAMANKIVSDYNQ